MSLTGGALNKLNGDYGISAPNKSVPVMKLIRIHKPKSKEELVRLIGEHNKTKCVCGIASQGTIEDFGKNLYDAQMKEWKECRFSLMECINWEYNLFVIQSLKGSLIEEKAKIALNIHIPQVQIHDAVGYLDEELRIDLELKKGNITIAGIQVKPDSYKHMRLNVKKMNTYRNSLVNFPVFYLYYDYDSEEFMNLNEIIEAINQL